MNNEIFVWLFWLYVVQSAAIIVIFVRWIWMAISGISKRRDYLQRLHDRMHVFDECLHSHGRSIFQHLASENHISRTEREEINARIADLETYDEEARKRVAARVSNRPKSPTDTE